VDYIFGMTEIQGISDGEHNLSNLFFSGKAMQIAVGVKFPSLAELHDDVEVARIIIDFIDLNDVGVFQLDRSISTNSMISH